MHTSLFPISALREIDSYSGGVILVRHERKRERERGESAPTFVFARTSSALLVSVSSGERGRRTLEKFKIINGLRHSPRPARPDIIN